jgi:hypothetical protein
MPVLAMPAEVAINQTGGSNPLAPPTRHCEPPVRQRLEPSLVLILLDPLNQRFAVPRWWSRATRTAGPLCAQYTQAIKIISRLWGSGIG